MRTFRFQEMLYRQMTDAELDRVLANPNDYLQYYVEACLTEKARRNA